MPFPLLFLYVLRQWSEQHSTCIINLIRDRRDRLIRAAQNRAEGTATISQFMTATRYNKRPPYAHIQGQLHFCWCGSTGMRHYSGLCTTVQLSCRHMLHPLILEAGFPAQLSRWAGIIMKDEKEIKMLHYTWSTYKYDGKRYFLGLVISNKQKKKQLALYSWKQ